MSVREDTITVVYDRNSVDSRAVAQDYAHFREKSWAIHMLPLDLRSSWVEDKISYAKYLERIYEPFWASDPGRYVVTCWGVPLKNYSDGTTPQHAIDNGIAMPIPGDGNKGWLGNSPMFRAPEALSGQVPAAAADFRMVGRMDAVNLKMAHGLIRRCIEAERSGWTSSLAVLDDLSQSWELEHARGALLRCGGWDVISETTNARLDQWPRPPAFWWGFYIAAPGQEKAMSKLPWSAPWFGFSKMSSSAQKLHTSYFAAGRMLKYGAFATIGAVREPLEMPYTCADLLLECFLEHGQTLGMAFAYANPWVRWQMILVGDPVMRMPKSP